MSNSHVISASLWINDRQCNGNMNGSKESTPRLQTAKQPRIAGVAVSEDYIVQCTYVYKSLMTTCSVIMSRGNWDRVQLVVILSFVDFINRFCSYSISINTRFFGFDLLWHEGLKQTDIIYLCHTLALVIRHDGQIVRDRW